MEIDTKAFTAKELELSSQRNKRRSTSLPDTSVLAQLASQVASLSATTALRTSGQHHRKRGEQSSISSLDEGSLLVNDNNNNNNSIQKPPKKNSASSSIAESQSPIRKLHRNRGLSSSSEYHLVRRDHSLSLPSSQRSTTFQQQIRSGEDTYLIGEDLRRIPSSSRKSTLINLLKSAVVSDDVFNNSSNNTQLLLDDEHHYEDSDSGSEQSIISLPFVQQQPHHHHHHHVIKKHPNNLKTDDEIPQAGQSTSVNLTHVYIELTKHEKRKAQLRELVEFHRNFAEARIQRQKAAAEKASIVANAIAPLLANANSTLRKVNPNGTVKRSPRNQMAPPLLASSSSTSSSTSSSSSSTNSSASVMQQANNHVTTTTTTTTLTATTTATTSPTAALASKQTIMVEVPIPTDIVKPQRRSGVLSSGESATLMERLLRKNAGNPDSHSMIDLLGRHVSPRKETVRRWLSNDNDNNATTTEAAAASSSSSSKPRAESNSSSANNTGTEELSVELDRNSIIDEVDSDNYESEDEEEEDEEALVDTNRKSSSGTPMSPSVKYPFQAPGRVTSIISKHMQKKNRFVQSHEKATLNLPRGGVVVNTRIGAIQIGIPPETIKDHMNAGLAVPSIFVVPQQRFHRWQNISVAEFEFPAYFSFFVLRKKVRLVTTKEAEASIRLAFQESLLGPVDLSPEAINEDFDPSVLAIDRPNLESERNHFANQGIDDLIEFVTLRVIVPGVLLEASLGDDIVIRLETTERREGAVESYYNIVDLRVDESSSSSNDYKKSEFLVNQKRRRNSVEYPLAMQSSSSLSSTTNTGREQGVEKTSTSSSTTNLKALLFKRRSSATDELMMKKQKEPEKLIARVSDSITLPEIRAFGVLDPRTRPFIPPTFGVTFLGTSHGFDPKASTTGFVVWVGGQGIIVDPPPNSGPLLEMMGIPPRSVLTVIVTHCHADHDAGTFQKIMQDERITIFGTPTIVNSFLRKYSHITDMSISAISSRFNLRKARVGQWMDVLGGQIRFFYAFHTIPCTGFELRFQGKSMVYSADTFYDPEAIRKLAEKGILTERRAQNLINFPFHHDLVLHECGVPPIHTPISCLAGLSNDIKSRLFLVHVTAANVSSESGLRVAREGVENTVVLNVSQSPASPLTNALAIVAWIRDAAPLKHLDLSQVHQLLQVTRLCTFGPSQQIFDARVVGTSGALLIIGTGSACVYYVDSSTSNLAQGDCMLLEPSTSLATTTAKISLYGADGSAIPTYQGVVSIPDETSPPINSARKSSGSHSVRVVALTRCQVLMIHSKDLDYFSRDGMTNSLIMRSREEHELRERFVHVDIVENLTLRQRALFAQLFNPISFRTGDVIWKAGTEASRAFIFSTGVLHITRNIRAMEASMNAKRGYDSQQSKEMAQMFLFNQRAIKQFNSEDDSVARLFLCDLPAMYHNFPLSSDLVCRKDCTGFAALTSDLMSFFRANPSTLSRLYSSFSNLN